MNVLVIILFMLFESNFTILKCKQQTDSNAKNRLYKQNTLIYFNENPIKEIADTTSAIEIFVFDLSLPKGQKRILWDTIPANGSLNLSLNYLEAKSYWFGYRYLGSDKVDVAQFTIK